MLGRSLWTSALAFFGPTAFSVVTSQASFAGARDDKAAEVAVGRYEAFLLRVAADMALVAVITFALLVLTTFCVLVTARAATRAKAPSRRVEVGLQVAIACAIVATGWGKVAHDHPGLFLETLSGSRLLASVAALSPIFLVALAAAAAIGAALTLFGGSRLSRVVVAATLAALAVAGYATHARGGASVTIEAVTASAAQPSASSSAHSTNSAQPAASESASSSPEPPAHAPGRKRTKPNILWIAVDSLRPDKIDAEHTPHIAKLLDESTYFPNAVVTVPRTGPSWASALTGLSPLTTGIETMFPRADLGSLEHVALPSHLRAHGYRTAVMSEYAGEFFGRVSLGFQTLSVPRVELAEISGQILLQRAPLVLAAVGEAYARDGFDRSLLGARLGPLVRGMPQFSHSEVLAEDTLALIENAAASSANAKPWPYFYLLFYSQPHFPYTSSAPYYRRWAAPGSSPEIAFGRDATNEVPIASDADRRQLDGLYRGALAETDDAIGSLLERLEQEKALDDTIVVLSADHGEGLYECATCVGHGDNLRGMTTLRIPLAFRLPKQRYPAATIGRREEWVSELDIYPTILSLLGESQIAVHEGKALFSSSGEPLPHPGRTFFAETGEWLWTTPAVPRDRIDYPPITGLATLDKNRIVIDARWEPVIRSAKHRAAIRPPFKLLYEPGASRVEFHLYRFDQDPYDDHDVAAENPEVFAELRRALMDSVLGQPHILPVGDYFVTRAPPPPEEEW